MSNILRRRPEARRDLFRVADYLAQHSLAPTWQYASEATTSGDETKVVLLRQFAVSGYGYAYLVNASGERYGLEVDLKNNTPTLATGQLPLSLEAASYPIITADEAVRSALSSSSAFICSRTLRTW